MVSLTVYHNSKPSYAPMSTILAIEIDIESFVVQYSVAQSASWLICSYAVFSFPDPIQW